MTGGSISGFSLENQEEEEEDEDEAEEEEEEEDTYLGEIPQSGKSQNLDVLHFIALGRL